MVETGLLAVDPHVGWDTSALCSALSSAANTLDALQACDTHSPEPGQTVWSVCSVRPFPCAFVYGPAAVRDAELHDLIARAGDVCDPSVCSLDHVRGPNLLCRWASGNETTATVDLDHVVQIPLMAGGAFYGVVQAAPVMGATPCAGLPKALETASAYLVLSLERMSSPTLLDPLTGLWSGEEFRRRVDVEVERARAYPVEFTLVLLEVRMGRDRAKGCLTETQVRAVAEVLVNSLRRSDSAGRLEDGRFGLLLPMASQRDSFIAVSRLMDRLREHPALSPDVECGIGVSGWSFEGSSGHELFRQAASALESAVSAGARGAFVFL